MRYNNADVARNSPGPTSRPGKRRGRISAARTARRSFNPIAIARVPAIATDPLLVIATAPVRATVTVRLWPTATAQGPRTAES